jgi:hypothetical protein
MGAVAGEGKATARMGYERVCAVFVQNGPRRTRPLLAAQRCGRGGLRE